MKEYYNYFYFRITQFFIGDTGRDIEPRSIVLIGLTETMLVWSLVIVCRCLFFNKTEIITNNGIFYFIVFDFLFIAILHYFRYKGKYNILHEKWQYESILNRRVSAILIIVILMIPWVTFYFLTR